MSLPLIISIVAFFTIAIIVFAFGAATVTPSSVLGSRLREKERGHRTSEADGHINHPQPVERTQ